MKKTERIIIAAVVFALCFLLSACGSKYVSHYSAAMMVSTNTADEASVSFDSFSGTYIMKLKNHGADEVFLSYEATLGDGNINVSYDYHGEKRNLFEIEANGSVAEKTETFTGNKTVYIIIESDGKCSEGSFSFVLEKSGK